MISFAHFEIYIVERAILIGWDICLDKKMSKLESSLLTLFYSNEKSTHTDDDDDDVDETTGHSSNWSFLVGVKSQFIHIYVTIWRLFNSVLVIFAVQINIGGIYLYSIIVLPSFI